MKLLKLTRAYFNPEHITHIVPQPNGTACLIYFNNGKELETESHSADQVAVLITKFYKEQEFNNKFNKMVNDE